LSSASPSLAESGGAVTSSRAVLSCADWPRCRRGPRSRSAAILDQQIVAALKIGVELVDGPADRLIGITAQDLDLIG
jgi:hypothetical protein